MADPAELELYLTGLRRYLAAAGGLWRAVLPIPDEPPPDLPVVVEPPGP